MAARRRATDPGGADWRDSVQPGDVIQVTGTRGREWIKVKQVDRRDQRTTRVQAASDQGGTLYNGAWIMRGGMVQKGTGDKLAAQARKNAKRADRKR